MRMSHCSYNPYYFAKLFEIESQHFWFRGRNQIIATLIKQVITGLISGYRVLEIGCGTGNVLCLLEQICSDGVVIGMDVFVEGLHYAHQRVSCPLVQGDIHTPPFHKQFDVIGMFDVLEHLPDDIQVLSDIYAMLTPGGTLLLSVPAYPSLWSYSDEEAHHCRRYEFPELRDKLSQAGFQIQYLTPYMLSMYPLVWFWRKLRAVWGHYLFKKPVQTHELLLKELRVVPIINDVLTFLLIQETRLIKRRRQLPFGTSLIAVGSKSSPSIS